MKRRLQSQSESIRELELKMKFYATELKSKKQFSSNYCTPFMLEVLDGFEDKFLNPRCLSWSLQKACCLPSVYLIVITHWESSI